MNGFATGLFAQGDFIITRAFNFTSGESASQGISTSAAFSTQSGKSVAHGVLIDAKIIAQALTGSSVATGSSLSIQAGVLSGTFETSGSSLASAFSSLAGTSISKGVTITEFEYVIQARSGKVVSQGTVIAKVEAGVLTGFSIAKGVNGDYNYITDGTPDIVVNRIDNDTVSIAVKNLDNRNIRIEKKADEIAVWSELVVVPPEDFDKALDISADLNPKFKAAFTVSGTKDGQPAVSRGRFSITNSIKKDV